MNIHHLTQGITQKIYQPEMLSAPQEERLGYIIKAQQLIMQTYADRVTDMTLEEETFKHGIEDTVLLDKISDVLKKAFQSIKKGDL